MLTAEGVEFGGGEGGQLFVSQHAHLFGGQSAQLGFSQSGELRRCQCSGGVRAQGGQQLGVEVVELAGIASEGQRDDLAFGDAADLVGRHYIELV